jgi:hypothetical protein
MSRKPSFANLRGVAPVPIVANPPAGIGTMSGAGEGATPTTERPASRVASREGRKQIAGFFSPDMSLAMHMLARRQGRSLQALMAEAFNDALRKYGESPVGD